MMKISIIGWYGTETLGDRAILAGILSLLSRKYDNFEVQLGSLFPFFSARTLKEDNDLIEFLSGKKIPITLFNTKNKKELDDALNTSDLLIMGGGPLMHINDLYMVDYAFRKAKSKGVRTILFGCGVGPMHKKKLFKPLFSILDNSDVCILRDGRSLDYLKGLKYSNFDHIKIGIDPSVEALFRFKKKWAKSSEEDFPDIAINLRRFPLEYFKKDPSIAVNINNKLMAFVKRIAAEYPGKQIHMIPMHYFHAGGDDRYFLNELAFNANLKNISVQNKPLSLVDTFKQFMGAEINIGMRFHSVVFQTVLNGKNYVLDYTEPEIGKISGFLNMVGNDDIINSRYLNLQSNYNDLSQFTLAGHLKPVPEVETALEGSLKVFLENI